MTEQPSQPGPAMAAEVEIKELLERARRGDREALPGLRRALDDHPELWRAYGDLAGHARAAWVGLIAGPDLGLAESLNRQAGAMRDELAGPEPTPLEGLLVERIVACWLQVGYADAAVAQAVDVSLKQADFARKRQDSAHRRYLAAVGALAMVRKLLVEAAGPAAPGRPGRSREGQAGPGVGSIRLADGRPGR